MKSILTFVKSLFRPISNRRNLTVRFMFPVFLGLAAIFGASVITSNNDSYVKLSPSKTVVMSGEQFYIEVYAFAHVPVNALDIELQFDPNSLDILSVDKGQSVLTIWSEEPKVQNNIISFGGGTFRRGFVGEHLLATIKVKAKKNGQTEFLIKNANFLAGDGKGTPVSMAKDQVEAKQSFVIYNQGDDPTKITADLGVNINADIDGDGSVTLKDVSTFMSAWFDGTKKFDFNGDNKMNFVDFSIILAKTVF